ncbi:MAG: zinc ABC transporter substrate-binding protein [Alkalispirochaeta sp.]
MKIISIPAVLLVFALLIPVPVAAGGSAEERPEYPRMIVATTGMIGDIVSYVAGDLGTVQVLMGSEVDPHLYRPTRADIGRMQNADIILYNGLMLEGRMGDTLVQLARQRPVYAVSELVDESLFREHDDYEEAYDPHLWMDVSLWMDAVQVVVTALSETDPPNADAYQSRGNEYAERLAELHEYIREIMSSIPIGNRYLVTAHDAFGYFGDAYDIEVIGVQGMNTESEAGLEDINSLVRFIVEREISAVFAETTVPDRALGAVIEGAASNGHEVVVGGELYSDAMGPTGTYEGTYLGMLDHNATTIVRALGGEAPAGGLHGRLSED